jgi:hypothetical protein
MKMRIFLFTVLCVNSLISCSCQTGDKETRREIIDPIIEEPFAIERAVNQLRIPTILRGKTNEGFFVLDLVITKNGEINSYSILRLTYKRDEKVISDFFKDQDQYIGLLDSSFVKQITPVIERYVHKNIRIKTNASAKTKEANIVRFLTRFN